MTLTLKKFSVICAAICLASLSSWALADEGEYQNMEEMMGSVRLEKKQVEGMLDMMMVSGRITAEEGQRAKRAIASMKETDLENLKTEAIAQVKTKKLLDH